MSAQYSTPAPRSPTILSLAQHLRQVERERPGGVADDLSPLMNQLAFAAKVLAREINRAALAAAIPPQCIQGGTNSTGDNQTRLDVYANQVVLDAFHRSTRLAGLVSEEMDELVVLSEGDRARIILCIDPIDGSSNTEINGSLGTIFGFYRRERTGPGDLAAELIEGRAPLVAAGYVFYGSGTLLVYSQGEGVRSFLLDRELGEFMMCHPDIRCPEEGDSFAANTGRLYEWHPGLQRYIHHISQRDPATRRPYSLRYSGALVADFHRCLLRGGVYFYPSDRGHAEGKLRLFYESAPLAFLVEQAGGKASDGRSPILPPRARSIHQRSTLVIGSAREVELIEKFVAEAEPKTASAWTI